MRRILLLSILAALLVGPLTAISMAQNINASEDEESIRNLMVEMTNGFNNHDAKAATRMYTPDGDFVSVRGEAANGATDVEAKLAAILATRARNASLKTLN
jgi:ketosteroid isomerase-like protein